MSSADPAATAGAPWPRFYVFGEALTDLVHLGDGHWKSVAGGSCWNVARVAATLGLGSAWCGAVSDDLFGYEIIEKALAAGLDRRFMQVVSRPPLIAVVHRTDPPQYFFLGDNAADLAFDETQLPTGWESHCEVAHFGCISLVRQPLGAQLVRLAGRLKARGTRISFDPNHRKLMGPDYPPLFEHMVALADIVKVSDEDLARIYPEASAAEALARVRSLAPEAWLLYTRGGDGLTLYRRHDAFEQPPFPVLVADSIGAGDACLGGFIASALSAPDAPVATHLEFAAATAATVCARSGAHAPERPEVERLMAARRGAAPRAASPPFNAWSGT